MFGKGTGIKATNQQTQQQTRRVGTSGKGGSVSRGHWAPRSRTACRHRKRGRQHLMRCVGVDVGLPEFVVDSSGTARLGSRPGVARHGKARPGKARQGLAWRGMDLGPARQGRARQGMDQGSARNGARQGTRHG